ncbi:MgtC/SapB family protein [Novosphingobium aquae]|uniref:Protein MgtC n=1 Tax=Novosphingobium aquae TaxID=3133435 RepID=A0ABU8SB87_9SPHN
MDLNPATALHEIDFEVLLRLALAALIGLLLGLDRELRGHPAGLRTHGLICFTAAAMTVSMIALYRQIGGSRMDPLRIFEASGAFVGIVGAGLIVFSGGRVKNLTTAAHLWLAAVAGIACGAGQWPLVAMAAGVSVVMLTLLSVVEKRLGTYDDDSERED